MLEAVPIGSTAPVARDGESDSSGQPVDGSGSTPSAAPRDVDVVRLALRALPVLLFGSVLFLVVRHAASPLSNPDTYFHLRFGREFLDGHWSLRHPGSVSTFATADWVPTQWLSEVVMAATEATFGLAGVAWLSVLLQLALVATLYLTSRRWAEPLVSVLLMVLAMLSMSLGLDMRPQVVSFILVTVTVFAWLKTLEDGRPRWWLIPLTWVWAMLHGMWPIGVALGVVGVVGLLIDRRTGWQQVVRAALVPVGSVVAAALTPVGPAIYGAVLGVGDRSRFFSEWAPPAYPAYAATEVLAVLVAATVVLMVYAPRRPRSDVVFLLVAGVCALWSLRTVPMAAAVLTLLAARAAQAFRPLPPSALRPRETWAVVSATVASLALFAVVAPVTSSQPMKQPAWVHPALSSLPSGTKVVSEWDDGGFLMWQFPQLDLLAHGYGDTFTTSELQRNANTIAVEAGWDRDLRETGCTVAVLEPNSALAYALLHSEGWRVVHHSTSLDMLVAPPGWSREG